MEWSDEEGESSFSGSYLLFILLILQSCQMSCSPSELYSHDH
jgi:hypothetical protein